MEYNPSLTPAYLAGKVDEYVKFAARDTIKRNAKRDRNCRYARIPDGGACDFCRMLGSRGFVYHSEESAGGVAHGSKYDTYHPYCNCQIAVCFDPFIEEYYVGWTKVTRGYGDGHVTVTGRDKSDKPREVDVDELYAEYKAMVRDFNKSGKSSRYKDYTKGARLTDEAFDAAMKRLSEARTLDELHEVGKDIVDNWPKNANGRDKRQWDELSRRAREMEEKFLDEGKPQLLRMTGKESFSYYSSNDHRIRDWATSGIHNELIEKPSDVKPEAWARAQSRADLQGFIPGVKLAVEDGLIQYEKPFSVFENIDEERRDVFAHLALVRSGKTLKALDEIEGQRNIDLLIDGKYWEVKSPIADGASKDPVKFVQNNLEKALRQFDEHPAVGREETRVVLNCRYTSVDEGMIAERIEIEMDKRPDFVEIVMIKRNGDVVHFMNG